MYGIGFGDLAISFRNVLQNSQTKSDLVRLGQELASGQTTDLKAATAGNIEGFSGIETALSNLAAYETNTNEAAFFAGTLQQSLSAIHDITSELAPALLSVGTVASAPHIDALAYSSLGKFETVIAALNTRAGERSLFAGTGVDGPAIANVQTMLADITSAIAGETTASGIVLQVENWFDDAGGGFETVGYLGENNYLEDFRLGAEFKASLQFRADDSSIRDVLKGYAMAALVANGVLAGSPEQRGALLEQAGSRLISAQSDLTIERAKVGTVEALIDQAIAHNTAETQSLEIAKAQILGVDPYQAATELQATETRLETLYTITARLSRLSLVEYIR